MWSWLPDELLQHLEQLVAEHAPRALATFALLEQRSRALAAARLSRIKPLLAEPFCLTAEEIFCLPGTLYLAYKGLRSEHVEVLGAALVSGALPNLTVLYLQANQIGDAGLSSLADAVSSGALDKLTVC